MIELSTLIIAAKNSTQDLNNKEKRRELNKGEITQSTSEALQNLEKDSSSKDLTNEISTKIFKLLKNIIGENTNTSIGLKRLNHNGEERYHLQGISNTYSSEITNPKALQTIRNIKNNIEINLSKENQDLLNTIINNIK